MPYVNLLPKEHDVKIISIDRSCLTEDTIRLLEGNESFKDTEDFLAEHIYSAYDILDNIEYDHSIYDASQLELIRDACENADASYFRTIKL